MNHPSMEDLYEYADGQMPAGDARVVAGHLETCPRCRGEVESVLRLAEAVRRMPGESPSPSFTRDLLRRLGIAEPVSVWWIFLRNFAPVLVAVVIVFVVLTIVSTGDPGGNIQKGLFDYGRVEGALKEVTETAAGGLAALLKNALVSTVGTDSAWLAAYLVALFLGIGLADRYLFGPLLRRRR